MRCYLSSTKPDIKEICKKKSYSSHYFCFVLENIDIFHKNVLLVCNRFIVLNE